MLQLTRHGNVPSLLGFQSDLFVNGPEHLTPTGHSQLHRLGQAARLSYSGLLATRVFSTNVLRTQESAQAFIEGYGDPTIKSEVDTRMNLFECPKLRKEHLYL